MKSFTSKAILFVATAAMQLRSNQGMSEQEAREIMMRYNVDGDVETWTKGEAALSFFDGLAQSYNYDGCDFEYFFTMGDVDGDGKLNVQEFIALVNSMPHQGPPNDQPQMPNFFEIAEDVMVLFNFDGDNSTLDSNEAREAYNYVLSQPGMEGLPPFAEVFQRYDSDYNGRLDVPELARFLEEAYYMYMSQQQPQPQPGMPNFDEAAKQVMTELNFDGDHTTLNSDEAREFYNFARSLPGMEVLPPFEEVFYRFDGNQNGLLEVSELARFIEEAYLLYMSQQQPQTYGPDFHQIARDLMNRYNFDNDFDSLNFDEARNAYHEVNMMTNGMLPPFEEVFQFGDMNGDSRLDVDEIANLIAQAYYMHMSQPPQPEPQTSEPDFRQIARDLMNRYNFDTDYSSLNFDEARNAYDEVNMILNGVLPPFQEVFYGGDLNQDSHLDEEEITKLIEKAYYIYMSQQQPQTSGPDFRQVARDLMNRYNFDTDYSSLNFDEARNAYDEVNMMLNGVLPPFQEVFYGGDLNQDSHLDEEEITKLIEQAYYIYMSQQQPQTSGPDYREQAMQILQMYNHDGDMLNLTKEEAFAAYTDLQNMMPRIPLPNFENVFHEADKDGNFMIDEQELTKIIESLHQFMGATQTI